VTGWPRERFKKLRAQSRHPVEFDGIEDLWVIDRTSWPLAWWPALLHLPCTGV